MAALLLAPAALAAEPAAKPLEYRRYFVPADRPQEWPKHNVTYLPVNRDEFEELVRAANGQPGLATGETLMAKARYTARLIEPDRLVGEAELEISHVNQKPTVVPLDPFAMALDKAWWADDTGATIGARPDGKLAVIVEHSGTLHCSWSMRGKRDPTGSPLFSLEFPPATVCELELELPAAWRPSIADGILTSEADNSPAGKWRFRLSGRSRAELRLQAAEGRARARRLVLLQEKTTYGLLPGSIDLAAQLRLDVYREPLRRLELELDSPLRIVSVQYGGAEIPWSVHDQGPAEALRAQLVFPEPLIGPARTVTVRAVAPFEIDVPVKLPRLRVRDAAWQEGEMALMIPGPMALDALLPQGCRQTKVSPLSGGASGENIELQLFSPEAVVEVQASRRRSPAKLLSGSTLRFAADAVRAEFRGQIASAEGELFALQARLAAGWEIDSITADRPGALANWSVDRSLRPPLIHLQFAEPVTPARPAQLMITGHRRAAADGRYAGETLDFVRFRDVTNEGHLLALETSSSQQLMVYGADRPRRKQRAVLSLTERSLLPSALSDAILEVDGDQRDWTIAIERQAPRYSADVRATIEVGSGEVHELYRIRCQPNGSRVDRLLVWFSQAHPEAVSWSGDDTIESLAAERLTLDPQLSERLPGAGELWLLRVPRGVSGPFEVSARRTIAVTGPVIPTLAAAPEAENQQGLVQIQCADLPLQIESADRLEPVPLQSVADDQRAAASAAFRYDPAAEMSDSSSPALVLRQSTNSAEPAKASVWQLRLYSRYRAAGDSRHTAVFEIENHGADECLLTLPPNAELLLATLDGAALTRRVTGPELKVTLPKKQTFPVVAVEFLLRERPMAILARCRAPWPSIDLPILDRTWMLSSAGQYELLNWSPSARPWQSRLLGTLSRQAGDSPFNPIKPADWRQLAARSHARDNSHERVTKLLEVMAHILASQSEGSPTLGRWLRSAQAKEPALFAPVCVDQRSLAAVGLDADTAVAVPNIAQNLAAARSAAHSRECLRSLGLALLIDGDQVIITTSATAAELAPQNSMEGDALVFERTPSDDDATRQSAVSVPCLPLASWLRSPETAWAAKAAHSSYAPFDAASPMYRIEADGTPAWHACLIRRDFVIAAGWAIAAAVFSLGAALRRGRLSWFACHLLLAILGGLWAPAALVPLASGFLGGALAFAAWMCLRPKHRERRAAAAPQAIPVGAWMTGSLILVLTACCEVAVCQEPMSDEAPDRPPVHRIFVPVDAESEPGTRYFVPTDFLDELRRRSSLANNEPRGWLITAAGYECTLAREIVDGPLSVSPLTTRFQFDVLSPKTRIRLPFLRRQVEVALDSAQLDGEPIELMWSAAGEELLCDIDEPGTYQLEFQLLPKLDVTPDMGELRVSIPKVAAATVDVWLPEEDVAVEIPDAADVQSSLETRRKLSARLGPLDALVLRWPRQAAVAPVAEVEELLWLNVRPGSVVLEVTLKLNVTSGVLRQLEFAADRRLRLVPGALVGRERPIFGQPEVSDAPQTIQVDLDQPLAGKTSLHLSFFLTGASGVGNTRLPAFHTLHARTVRRWLAVTVDAGLEYVPLGAEQLDALPATDFAAEWGDAEKTLDDALAYRLNSAESGWSLSTRSREPQTTVKETLSLGFRREHALLRYDAELMTSAGFVFQHRLLVPAEVAIERITLEEDGVDRVAHWARGADGVVSVFLNRRLTGPQKLTLVGRLPVRANGRLSVPWITMQPGGSPVTIERAEVFSRRIHFYRQPTVRIELEDSAGLSPLSEPPTEVAHDRFGRLAFSRAAEPDFSATVGVVSNEYKPRDVVQMTTLHYANQQWIADVTWRFAVVGGVLDTLRIGIPAMWAENVEVLSPASNVGREEQPGSHGVELAVQPLVPLSGKGEVKLRATLKLAPGEPVIVPDMTAIEFPAGQRYWLLPRQVGAESVNWDVQRLAPDDLPDAAGTTASDAGFVFRALGEHPQAVMSGVKASVEVSRVRLADVRLSRRHGGLTAAVAFDLEPGGRPSCPLELAAGWRLLQVAVGGTFVAPLAKEPGKWEVPLRSNRLPQRLEAILSSDAGTAAEQVPLPVAWCENWPVEETLLTVHAADGERVEVDARPVYRVTCDSARMASVLELTDLPAETVATTPTDDLAAWYAPWAHWFDFFDPSAEPPESGAADSEAAAAHALLREKWAQVAKKLGFETAPSTSAPKPPRATQLMEIWQRMHVIEPADYYQWAGPRRPTQMRFVRGWSGRSQRLMQSLVVVALVVVAVTLLRGVGVGDLVNRWPYALGAGVGVLWWLFCEPSAVGWLLIGLSVTMGLRSIVRPLAG